ncbi:hypothetical protein [Candidatus Paracaedibacter symbiosus]|uniref:hypothetical protein n=1 Tax=Candidatus Paracaedibacter symbiosus TaxID=244582 RepID=UPI000509C0C6|nr:hypothetical protein [Candidatus Paracaedibacter symbiosus]
MKNCILLNLLFTAGTAAFAYAHSAEETFERFSMFGQGTIQPRADNSFDWHHVKARFKREKFLKDYNKDHALTLGQVTLPADSKNEELNEACWKALFNLKRHYKSQGDKINYGFVYLGMAKFLLTHNAYPEAYNNDYKKRNSNSNYVILLAQK